jgi:ribonucleoside-triphosphate reductase
LAGKVTNAVVASLDHRFKDAIPTVEQVQDLVEEELQKNKAYNVAKRYILYRAERTKVRDAKTKLMQSLHEITFKDAVILILNGRMPILMPTLQWEQC